jgi:FO synthase subunit 1
LKIETVKLKLEQLKSAQVREILILSGEVHPGSFRRRAWLELIEAICEQSLLSGFLPHTNAGPLNEAEMQQLQSVNVSMGLMLEQLTDALLKGVHQYAPSKSPQLRLQQLEQAGKLKIPFTTGLLLGIGESESDWWDSLEAIAKCHRRWGQIQEVILQPYCIGTHQSENIPGFDLSQLPQVIAAARAILPDSITIQIPPNLIANPSLILKCLDAGARDLGGIVPKDEVNPDYDHLDLQSLTALLHCHGWQLKPRLAVYPQYYSWLSPQLQQAVKRIELETK